MRKKFCVKGLLLSLAAAGLALSVFSCSKEDTPPVPSVKDAEGNYAGKVTMSTPEFMQKKAEEAPQGSDVSAEVKNDTIYIKKFPVDQVIISIVGEDAAAGIIEAIGEVDYKVGYTGALNAAQDSICLQMNPKPLEIDFQMAVSDAEPIDMHVEVSIAAGEKGNFAYGSRKLKFKLDATAVKVGELPFNFDGRTFDFVLDKK